MRAFRTILHLLCACFAAALPGAPWAGSFNCAVVYDEFESLMNGQFLTDPDQFVSTLPGGISREQFEGVANANFHLYPDRDNMGIGILTTNQNTHAKFLFHWTEPLADGTTHVVIHELVTYGRVADGYAPTRTGPFRLKPGMTLDVDSGGYVPMDDTLLDSSESGNEANAGSGDLLYEEGEGGTSLKSVNGAQVQFPLETLCQQGSS